MWTVPLRKRFLTPLPALTWTVPLMLVLTPVGTPPDAAAGSRPSPMRLTLVQTQGHSHGEAAPTAQPERLPTPRQAGAGTLSLSDLEQMALRGNPTLAQAAAQIEAAHGRALQAGLYPNPSVGYQGEQIGSRAGPLGERQGAFIDQTIVTAGKLRLSRAKFSREADQAQWQAVAQEYRVLNGVRVRFYQLLALQRLLEVRADLLAIAEDAVKTTEELVNVGAANRADLLQARLEARQERVGLENARTQYLAAWQELAALVGAPDLPPPRLDGDLEGFDPLPEWDATLAHLLEASPEVQVARLDVSRTQIALKRERVEPVPNVTLRLANGYNFETRSETTDVLVGVQLPVFNKNQGNIRAAAADVGRAQAEVGRVELSLRQRLARQYARYRTAQALIETYRAGVLPEAREAYQLYLESFRARRAAWPQVLVAQRTYFQISVDYVQALSELRRAQITILGLLLVDGLEEPPGLPSEGRAQPRGPQSQPGTLPEVIDPRRGRGTETPAAAGG